VYCGLLQDFAEVGTPFSLGIGLHCCGLLTDWVQQLCISRGAHYIICPCCYGQITNPSDATWRSEKLRTEMNQHFKLIGSAADFTVPAEDWSFPSTPSFHIAKKCMTAIDYDRSLWAQSLGYCTDIGSLNPLNCSPKNNIIIGVPAQDTTGIWLPQKNNLITEFAKAQSTHPDCKPQKSIKTNKPVKSTNELPNFYSYTPENYHQLLQQKVIKVFESVKEFIPGPQQKQFFDDICICESPPKHFRLRCRFQLELERGELNYLMWENGGPNVVIKDFPIASPTIYLLMPHLRDYLQNSPFLCGALKAVNFLSTLHGDCLISLIYQNRQLDDNWDMGASELRDHLFKLLPDRAESKPIMGIIGRSKNNCRNIGCGVFVNEVLQLKDGTSIRYRQIESSFSNPNGIVNQRALDWICGIALRIKSSMTDPSLQNNLLELYCGNGNHTCALARFFHEIVAVELDTKLCQAATHNLEINGISNAEIVQVHSETFCRKILATRKYRSMKDGKQTLEFHSVLVDPPRAGLDATTLSLVAEYSAIIYISCNPNAFLENYKTVLSKTHTIVAMAVFDQFAYTEHVECGYYLTKRELSPEPKSGEIN